MITLIGDSIFDNHSYVPKNQAVINHLNARLGSKGEQPSSAMLLARDGALTSEVTHQLPFIPAATTQLFLSIGGNDALRHLSILSMGAKSNAEVFLQLAKIRQTFENNYLKMLIELLDLGLPLTVCTIYNPNFPNPQMQEMAKIALTVFNDVILSLAIQYSLPVIDLRIVCADPLDFANAIEPSGEGGWRIAKAIYAASKGEYRNQITW